MIYSWPFPGCVLAKSKDDLIRAILNFSKLTSVNTNGISQVQELLTPNPAEKFGALLTELLKKRNPAKCIRGIGIVIKHRYGKKN